MIQLDPTHDPAARSWLPAANAPGGDFSVQNLPFAVLRRRDRDEAFRGAVAIGDQALDLAALAATRLLQGRAAEALAGTLSSVATSAISIDSSSGQIRTASDDLAARHFLRQAPRRAQTSGWGNPWQVTDGD